MEPISEGVSAGGTESATHDLETGLPVPVNGGAATVVASEESAPTTPIRSAKAMLNIDEPYMEHAEIALKYPLSNINVADIEKSAGLCSEEAAKRLTLYGKNVLTPPPKMPEWRRFLMQFQNMFMLLLNTCGFLSVIAYALQSDKLDRTNLYLAIVLFVVVFLTCFLQFHEEGKAYKIMDSFTKMFAVSCKVIRDGKQKEVPVGDIVVGDIVIVNNGDKVTADLVLLLCRSLKSECSSLTGESRPISCNDRPSKKETRIFECKNVAFSSSLCFDGMAIGIVVLTGDNTAIGTIAGLASSTKLRESTLQKEVRRFVALIAAIAVTMATVFFIGGVLISKAQTSSEIISIFINGFLVIIVANTPQGLPATVTSLLSLAARNMAKRSVLVKRIDCVETLGSTSLICSDKTGTLTTNEMKVTDIWLDRRHHMRRKGVAGPILHGTAPNAVFLRAATLCNRGQAVTTEEHDIAAESIHSARMQKISNVSRLSWSSSIPGSTLEFASIPIRTFSGNPSDCALLTYCNQICSTKWLRHDYPILFEIPFNSKNKWQLVVVKSVGVHHCESGMEEYEVLMKGAPEVILSKCATHASSVGEKHQAPIDDGFTPRFTEAFETFAAGGKRVLALCNMRFQAPTGTVFAEELDETYNFPTTDLNFIGLVGIMDPPRENVPDAIAKCHSAGVKVFMVTGDHPLTGRSIAEEIGLLESDNNIELLENTTTPGDWSGLDGAVVHGCRLEALTKDQWKSILSKSGVVFARTTPDHKLEIVRRCQGLGYIVAVTGDGVNDAPALKQADVGIAMGLNGSDVAQESADIVLMDDNFASIVSGIEEGRIIFDNIKKTIAYTMAHILPEVISAVLNLLFLLPLGLTAMQVLTIDLGTELGPAISLAYEKAETDIMQRKPRDPLRDRLVSPSLLVYSYLIAGSLVSAACFLSYMFIYQQHGIYLSDFPLTDPSTNRPGNFFSLTAEVEITIPRTGDVFTADQQRNIFSQAATAFYITLTVTQFFHIWVCKTRVNSLFVHGFGNRTTFYGVLVGLLLTIFFSYVPGVHNFTGSAIVNWTPWAVAPVAGAILWIYNESYKALASRNHENRVLKFLTW
jgi:sodium/potassium-transporting ATPase subunit alpha